MSPGNGSEATARERSDFLTEVVSEVETGVAAYDSGGTIRYANECYAEMLDTSRAELEGEHITVTNPEFDREQFRDYWDSFGDGETRRTDTHHRTLDGNREFPVSVTTTHTTIGGREYHVGTVIDITERKEYEGRLQKQRDNLEILNQVVRHDIRNDLQLVQAYADLLADHVDEEGQEFLATVQESAANAIEVTTTARDLADVMLQSDIDNQQVPLAHTLEQEVDNIRSAHPEAVIRIDGSIPDVTVTGNEMLGAVFRNLLKNAVQHNDEDIPVVAVSATAADGWVEVRVADNGPGVSDAQKEAIFGEGQKGLDSAGSGIGLYLVRTLVDGYGGEVWVEDRESPAGLDGDEDAPDGAVFVVRLDATDT